MKEYFNHLKIYRTSLCTDPPSSTEKILYSFIVWGEHGKEERVRDIWMEKYKEKNSGERRNKGMEEQSNGEKKGARKEANK